MRVINFRIIIIIIINGIAEGATYLYIRLGGHRVGHRSTFLVPFVLSRLTSVHLIVMCFGIVLSAACVIFMVALWNRADHYFFMLWFVLSSFFTSPNLSRRRLDVCHSSTHGVALVRI